ncbi:GntR family transcriptional regulator [Microbacterium wangchenii]|uniref:GntR family transcriptional regulator n=1 Tax=Microbacterium wangchenii TaxID=2541726 RepID=UPI0011C78CCA|nr:GntR family transcriptional regulator [Microbacterium wangchenii]TXK16024.1 GntR family transcriptional regulator [Microbacterium wangchenii]
MGRHRSVDISELDLPAALAPDRPRGDQIRERLEALAVRLGPGATLPSDRQLADHFGVARMTVRTEIKRLAIDGVLEVEHGRGTFVARAPRLAPEWGTSYTVAARAANGNPSSTLLESAADGADPSTARLLGIAEGAPVLTVTRLRALDGRPVGVERVSIPLDRFPGLDEVDLENVSLYEVLAERWGLVRASSTGRAAATLPGEADAAVLGVTVRDPCLVVQMTSTDVDGRVFEVGRSVYRADRYEIGIDLMHQPNRA